MSAQEELLTSGEVADLFRVLPRTVIRWAAEGRLPRIVTPGGRNRYRRADVDALLFPQVHTNGDEADTYED